MFSDIRPCSPLIAKRPHAVISQMIENFIIPAVRTSNTTHILTVKYKFVPVAIASTEVWRCTES
jgi:hypothetical protein